MEARYGQARQMIVDALWRFLRSPLVRPALTELVSDPDVALHAMSALRRTIRASRGLALPAASRR
jgi:hypothetical protein